MEISTYCFVTKTIIFKNVHFKISALNTDITVLNINFVFKSRKKKQKKGLCFIF